jgi:hypothetical protein
MSHARAAVRYDAAMIKAGKLLALALVAATAACANNTSADRGAAGTGGAAGAAGGPAAGGASGGAAGATGLAGAGGSVGTAGSTSGANGDAGDTGQPTGVAGVDASADTVEDAVAADGAVVVGVNMVPADYEGTPLKALAIPGTIFAADYDRGGAKVAFCRTGASCTDGITTGDWSPATTPPYRPPVPATAKICSGAACDDNVGLCRINPNKPDRTLAGVDVTPIDTYVCYSIAGEWLKYTVAVTEAGTYSVGGFMAVPAGGGVNLSFGGGITTGDVALPLSPTTNCRCSENYHSWAQRDNLATVTFPAAGTYLMTMTQVGRFNADRFTFTKM